MAGRHPSTALDRSRRLVPRPPTPPTVGDVTAAPSDGGRSGGVGRAASTLPFRRERDGRFFPRSGEDEGREVRPAPRRTPARPEPHLDRTAPERWCACGRIAFDGGVGVQASVGGRRRLGRLGCPETYYVVNGAGCRRRRDDSDDAVAEDSRERDVARPDRAVASRRGGWRRWRERSRLVPSFNFGEAAIMAGCTLRAGGWFHLTTHHSFAASCPFDR